MGDNESSFKISNLHLIWTVFTKVDKYLNGDKLFPKVPKTHLYGLFEVSL